MLHTSSADRAQSPGRSDSSPLWASERWLDSNDLQLRYCVPPPPDSGHRYAGRPHHLHLVELPETRRSQQRRNPSFDRTLGLFRRETVGRGSAAGRGLEEPLQWWGKESLKTLMGRCWRRHPTPPPPPPA